MNLVKQSELIGMDESGVGDYFTPLVCAAAYIPKINLEKVIALGVRDSKELSKDQIQKIASELKNLIFYSVKHLTPLGYNKLNKTFNAHELKTFLHFQCLDWLIQNKLKDQEIEKIILDEFTSKKNIALYIEHLRKSSLDFTKNNYEYEVEQKAESKYLAVAAASIIARDFLLNKMVEQSKKWKINFPLGASSQVISVAKEFVKKYGEENLIEVAKIKFKTTEQVLSK